MISINSTYLLKKFKGNAKTWKYTMMLAGIRFVALSLLLLLLLSTQPILVCVILVVAQLANYGLGFVFTYLMKKEPLHYAEDIVISDVAEPKAKVLEKAEAALKQLHAAAEAEASLRKALEHGDIDSVTKIMSESAPIQMLINKQGPAVRQRSRVFAHHAGGAAVEEGDLRTAANTLSPRDPAPTLPGEVVT